MATIEVIFQIIGVLATVCTSIVKVFSGCKWAAWVVKVCDWFSFVNTKEDKEKIASATKKKAK